MADLAVLAGLIDERGTQSCGLARIEADGRRCGSCGDEDEVVIEEEDRLPRDGDDPGIDWPPETCKDAELAPRSDDPDPDPDPEPDPDEESMDVEEVVLGPVGR